MGSIDADAFVAALKWRFDDPQNVLNDHVLWVGGGVGPDGAALVFYREHSDGPVLGRRYDVVEFASGFDPLGGVEDLADIAFSEDITDPTGRGVELPVDWADGLVPEGVTVEWVGEPAEDEKASR